MWRFARVPPGGNPRHRKRAYAHTLRSRADQPPEAMRERIPTPLFSAAMILPSSPQLPPKALVHRTAPQHRPVPPKSSSACRPRKTLQLARLERRTDRRRLQFPPVVRPALGLACACTGETCRPYRGRYKRCAARPVTRLRWHLGTLRSEGPQAPAVPRSAASVAG
jgi:hypothetical protein